MPETMFGEGEGVGKRRRRGGKGGGVEKVEVGGGGASPSGVPSMGWGAEGRVRGNVAALFGAPTEPAYVSHLSHSCYHTHAINLSCYHTPLHSQHHHTINIITTRIIPLPHTLPLFHSSTHTHILSTLEGRKEGWMDGWMDD